MKLKPHSIRFKFFSAISLVALMFIGILLLLNLFFYQDYSHDDAKKQPVRRL